jgi:hypothetical protein
MVGGDGLGHCNGDANSVPQGGNVMASSDNTAVVRRFYGEVLNQRRVVDLLGHMQQLGVIPAPGGAPA